MFAGFNLEISKAFFELQPKSFQEYQKIGKEHIKIQSRRVESALEKYITNSIVDGSKMQKDWFPEVDTDIFLSHSSIDTELVNAIAGWINDTFELSCFIDSNVWCYAGNLADKLNDCYSNKREDRNDPNGGFLYNHKKCLKVSEHVNTMLNIALQKMIDKCESVILINTDNSININSDNESIDVTYSPWIYSELICSEIVRKKPLYFYRYDNDLFHSISESKQFADNSNDLIISYNAPTQHLIKIDKYVLKKWNDRMDKNYPFPLDLLYTDYFKEEVEKTRRYFKY